MALFTEDRSVYVSLFFLHVVDGRFTSKINKISKFFFRKRQNSYFNEVNIMDFIRIQNKIFKDIIFVSKQNV